MLDRNADELLALLDHPVPAINAHAIIARLKTPAVPKSTGAPIRQIAAGLALLFVAFGAASAIPASPIRNFWVSVVARLGSHQRGNPVKARSVSSAVANQGTRGSSALAVVPDSAFDIVFSHAQDSGVIRVQFVDGRELRVNSSLGSTSFTLGRHQVLADNVSSIGNFDVAVPKGLHSFRIVIGSDTALQRMGFDVRTAGTQDAPGSFTLPFTTRGPKPSSSYKIR
ncbi:MAG: hypothetical protein NVSMB53_11950 [Gemmatimonadaceae bacterium]